MRGREWPEADRLFHSDPRWRGSDDAYSVPLGGDRTLWLFGDTFVSEDGKADRARAAFVRNTVGIQEGNDPSSASISFAWGSSGQQPGSFFESEEGTWLWPLHGARLGQRVLLTFMHVRPPVRQSHGAVDDWRELGPLGFFEVFGWRALTVENPDEDPVAWKTETIDVPSTAGIVVGASFLTLDDFLYSYGWRDQKGYLVRWALEDAMAADLSRPEWRAGGGWVRDPGRATIVLPDARTEFTVHHDPDRGFIHTQAHPPLGSTLAVRAAERPEGPWSDLEPVFEPEEASRPGVMIYAGKAHPQLEGAGLVMTYATNGRDVDATLSDESIYYPRFVKVANC